MRKFLDVTSMFTNEYSYVVHMKIRKRTEFSVYEFIHFREPLQKYTFAMIVSLVFGAQWTGIGGVF